LRSIVGGALWCGHPEAGTLFYDDLLNHDTDWLDEERDLVVLRARRPHMQLAMMAIDRRTDDAPNTLARFVRLLHPDTGDAAMELLESDYFRQATGHLVGLPAQAASLKVDVDERAPEVRTIHDMMLNETVRNMTKTGAPTSCTIVEELLFM
jgi:hypothetical protein